MHRLNFLFVFLILNANWANCQIDYRPKYHYAPPKNWVNDPNGLVYLDGEYHIFTQYNPFGDKWGHMSWGHAVSKDLFTWKELPLALPEYINKDGKETMIFSGCTVVDSLNTSGFFEKNFKKGLVAIFTSNVHEGDKGIGQQQSLAYSIDKGNTWKYYDKNPVLDIGIPDFRDPNVIWNTQRQAWLLTCVKPLEFLVQFYESKDLKNWELLSEFGKTGDTNKIWECPSLIKVPVDNSKETKWVLMLSCANRNKDFVGMQYFVGDFNGKNFVSQPQASPLYVDEGKDFYAAIPFYNLPKSRKKPIILGWTNNWVYAADVPTSPFRGSYSVGREISLYKKNNQYNLRQTPYVQNVPTEKIELKYGQKLISKIASKSQNSYRLQLDINMVNAKGFTLQFLKSSEEEYSSISYELLSKTLTFDRTKSGNTDFNKNFPSKENAIIAPENNHLKFDILVDKSVVEIFINHGKTVITDLVFPTKADGNINFEWK